MTNSDLVNQQAQIQKFKDEAKLPERQTDGAAGYDVYAAAEIIIEPGDTGLVPLGIGITPPPNSFIMLVPRGSLSKKKNLIMPHSVGIGDEDFIGEYMMPLRNIGESDQTIEKHERIGQMLFLPYLKPIFKEVDKLTKTDRGTGSFGSTGKF